MLNCVLFIFFSRISQYPSLKLDFLICLQFIFVYGVREYSNLMFIFMAERSFTISSIVAVTNLHPKDPWRRVPLSPHPLQQLLFLESLATAILTGVMQYCCSHVFRETNSLRRTMQTVECSLLHWWTQGKVSSQPRTPHIFVKALYILSVCAQTHIPKFSETSLNKEKERYNQS